MSTTDVLVVDDDTIICLIIHRMLSDEQYEVQTAHFVADAGCSCGPATNAILTISPTGVPRPAPLQQLVCQLTTQIETETIISSFQNAQAGDIILSPIPVGTGDLIAAMFSALTPPQHHGHSGIMTANFFELTHCAASVDHISAKANLNYDAAGIPTGLNSNMLQYAAGKSYPEHRRRDFLGEFERSQRRIIGV
jgi:hypothetical protein